MTCPIPFVCFDGLLYGEARMLRAQLVAAGITPHTTGAPEALPSDLQDINKECGPWVNLLLPSEGSRGLIFVP